MASLSLFGKAFEDAHVLAQLATAVSSSPTAHSLVATVFSHDGEFTAAGPTLGLLIRTTAPACGPWPPVRLMLAEHERSIPEIKHVGESSKTLLLREAVAQGFDDAAFMDRHGRIGEATIWNLAFWDGERVIWPEADILPGVTMRILQRQLRRVGVAQKHATITVDTLKGYQGAALMNSWTPGVEVHEIGNVAFPATPDFLRHLQAAYANEPEAPLDTGVPSTTAWVPNPR